MDENKTQLEVEDVVYGVDHRGIKKYVVNRTTKHLAILTNGVRSRRQLRESNGEIETMYSPTCGTFYLESETLKERLSFETATRAVTMRMDILKSKLGAISNTHKKDGLTNQIHFINKVLFNIVKEIEKIERV